MADEKIKGFRMSQDALNIVNDRIAASGMDAYDWLESLMSLETVHQMRKKDPAVENDLKDFEKHMNVIYHILIRMYHRGADTVDDIKEQTEREKSLIEGKIEELAKKLSLTQKKLHEKEEALALVQESNDRLTANIEQVQSSLRLLEELNQFTTVENQKLKKTIDKQEDAVKVVEELRFKINEINNLHEEEMSKQLQLFNTVNTELEQANQKYESLQVLAKEEAVKKEGDHKRELELLRKEIETKAKEVLLDEKAKWHEKMNQEISELNTQNTNTISKLILELSQPKDQNLKQDN